MTPGRELGMQILTPLPMPPHLCGNVHSLCNSAADVEFLIVNIPPGAAQ